MSKRPGIGLSILVFNSSNNSILLSKRLKDKFQWATPGGNLELFEELEDCCVRELKEETDLLVQKKDLHFLFFKNLIIKEENYHYLDFFFACLFPNDQKIINTEPDKHSDWEWVGIEELFGGKVDNLFIGLKTVLEEMKSSENLRKKLEKAFDIKL